MKSILHLGEDELLTAVGVADLPESDRIEVLASLSNHLQKVILETIILSLNEEQAVEFEKVMSESVDDELEEKIMEIVSGVPGLASKIEIAVADELVILKEVFEASRVK
jgi:hypothetical protein